MKWRKVATKNKKKTERKTSTEWNAYQEKLPKQIRTEVLVLSPTPSHPQDQGNRKRIYQVCKAIQMRGARVHFLYFPREWGGQFNEKEYTAMSNEWDFFHVVPPSKDFVYQTENKYFYIDDWWDDAIGHFIKWKTNGFFFDAVICNYAFFSKSLEFFPEATLKILDTHDRLSDRRELLERNNVTPEFFYTSKAEERIGLERADLVLAIKDEEADFFRSLCSKPVITLGHEEPERFIEVRQRVGTAPLRVGFLGSSNSINLKNLEQFLIVAHSTLKVRRDIEIHIAGSICDRLVDVADLPNVKLYGRVDDVADFYREIDLIFIPFEFSTGLKIKAVEGLSFGLPLVSTKNAAEGLPVNSEFHRLENHQKMLQMLVRLVDEPEALIAVRNASRALFERIQKDLEKQLNRVFQSIAGRFITIYVDDAAHKTSVAAILNSVRTARILEALAEQNKLIVNCPNQITFNHWSHLLRHFPRAVCQIASPEDNGHLHALTAYVYLSSPNAYLGFLKGDKRPAAILDIAGKDFQVLQGYIRKGDRCLYGYEGLPLDKGGVERKSQFISLPEWHFFEPPTVGQGYLVLYAGRRTFEDLWPLVSGLLRVLRALRKDNPKMAVVFDRRPTGIELPKSVEMLDVVDFIRKVTNRTLLPDFVIQLEPFKAEAISIASLIQANGPPILVPDGRMASDMLGILGETIFEFTSAQAAVKLYTTLSMPQNREAIRRRQKDIHEMSLSRFSLASRGISAIGRLVKEGQIYGQR